MIHFLAGQEFFDHSKQKVTMKKVFTATYILFGLMISLGLRAQDRPFITTWKTDNPGSSEDTQITIPTYSLGSYNYDIYWEDVNDAAINGTLTGLTGKVTIDFPAIGTYQVEISGSFPRIYFGSWGEDTEKILTVEQWGDIHWASFYYAFRECKNVTVPATDAPDLSDVTDLRGMFSHASSFNDPIGHWDVSNVTDMYAMFSGASSFNQDIGGWNVSNVTEMRDMFYGASSFNQDIQDWNVGKVTMMDAMFKNASSFNQNLTAWDVSNVISMDQMFFGASSFNGDLSAWSLSSLTSMTSMFEGAFSFNQDLNQWDVSKVSSMDRIFFDASSFNGDISAWDLSNVTSVSSLFEGATSFNQDISSWDVSNVKSMWRLFHGASSFNQDISSWDVSNVRSMWRLFHGASSFNQDIGDWDVSEVTEMTAIFNEASSFNQDISNWDIRKVRGLNGTLIKSGISQQNYDHLLFGWSSLPGVPSNLSFLVNGLTYCLGTDARQNLIDNYGWSIKNDSRRCDFDDFGGRSGSVALQIGGEAFLGLGRNDSIYFGDWLNISSGLDSVADFPGVARASAVAFVIDSLAYVGLGIDEDGNYLSDFYSYSPAQDLWTPIADFGGGARTNAVSFSMGGQGYVGTGKNGQGEQSDFWKYDPATNVWTEVPNWGKDKRQGAFSFVIGDKAYVGGGYYFDGFQSQLSDIQEFDPATETWTEKIFADGLHLSVNDAAAFSLYGQGYIAYGSKSNLIKYDPRTNEVENLGDYFNLGTNRTDPIAYTVGDFGYFGLGRHGFSPTEHANDFEIYFVPNSFPSDISLSANTIVENNEAGTFIGVLSSVDTDALGSPTYKLFGDDAREAFYISNDTLRTKKTLNYEEASSYAATIQVKDARGGSYKEVFDVLVLNIPELPTMIEIDRSVITEDDDNIVFISEMRTNGDNGPFAYEITSGDGENDLDNDQFQIDDNQLFIINPNYEDKPQYLVNIEVTDQAGVSFSRSFDISLENAPEWPIDITISPGSVDESEEPIEFVGVLEAKGDDPLTFSIIPGDGINDADNDRFEIRKDSLFIINPNYEEQELFSLYAQVMDADGDTYEKAFTITVNDVNEAPYEMEMVFEEVPLGKTLASNTLIGKLHTDDPDNNETFTYTLEDQEDLFYVSPKSELKLKKSNLFKLSEGIVLTVRSTDKGGLFLIRVFEYKTNQIVLSAPVAQLEVYPNPFEQMVHLRTEHPAHAQIYSITGALITEQTLAPGDNSIDLGAHPAGVYILRMHQGEIMVDHKIIKR